MPRTERPQQLLRVVLFASPTDGFQVAKHTFFQGAFHEHIEDRRHDFCAEGQRRSGENPTDPGAVAFGFEIEEGGVFHAVGLCFHGVAVRRIEAGDPHFFGGLLFEHKAGFAPTRAFGEGAFGENLEGRNSGDSIDGLFKLGESFKNLFEGRGDLGAD